MGALAAERSSDKVEPQNPASSGSGSRLLRTWANSFRSTATSSHGSAGGASVAILSLCFVLGPFLKLGVPYYFGGPYNKDPTYKGPLFS